MRRCALPEIFIPSMARSLIPQKTVAGSHWRSAAAFRSRTNRVVLRMSARSGCHLSGSTTAYDRQPGPCNTVPPPLARRRIEMPSRSQVARLTSSATREARPRTTNRRSLSQNRSTGSPLCSSSSSNNASSSARFSTGSGRVRSSNRSAGTS